MAKYVALMRGIGPSGPNMTNDKLRSVLTALGYEGVQSVISSGNVVFESTRRDVRAMEAEIEAAWPRLLGFESTTIIRSQKQLERLLAAKAFKDIEHSTKSYLMVTFFKRRPKFDFELPFQPPGRPFQLVYYAEQALCSVTGATVMNNDPGGWLERRYGKEITSRTRLTVERILRKMEDKNSK